MNIGRIFIIILFLVSLGSCNSTKLIPKEKHIVLDTTNFRSLAGRYNNRSADSAWMDQTTLWFHFPSFIFRVDRNTLSSVEIKILNEKAIEFKLYHKNELQETKKFRYHLKNGVILIKRRSNRVQDGTRFLVFKQEKETLNLSLTKESDLILGYKRLGVFNVLIVPIPEWRKGMHVFKKQ